MNKLVRLFVLAGLSSSGAFAQETALPNKTPDAGSVHITPNTGLCAGGYNYLFSEFTVDDPDGHALSITSATSSDQSVLADQAISYYTVVQIGNTTQFQVNTGSASTGTVDITFTVSDGEDEILVTATVVFGTPEPVEYISGEMYFCTNAGIVNLEDQVTVPGGTFELWESDIPSLLDVSDYETGSSYNIYYHLNLNGCDYSISSNMTIQEAPYADLSIVEEPGCGTNDGEISAMIDTEGSYTYFWSNGIQQELAITDLAPGIYFFNITDANNGCSATASIDLVPSGVEIEALSVTDLTCFGSQDGAISVEVSGMTAPYTYLWSSGHTGPGVTGLAAGTYTVTVQNETGCTVTASYAVNQPAQLVSFTGSSSASCGGADGSVYINSTEGGDENYSYTWNNSATGTEVNNLGFGIYSVTTTDGAGCNTINTVYLSEYGGPGISGTVTPTSCGEHSGAIDVSLSASSPVASISWSNGATTEDISNLAAATYVCTAVTESGCTSLKGWTLEAVTPLRNDICIVTVDSLTTTNLVVWEKVQTTGISHYNIYRETSQFGEYVLIDTVHYDNLSVFNDVVASPKVRSWRYKISAVNGCGQESPLSAHHKTLHLNAFEPGEGTVLITWDTYEGTAYTSYDLWRYTDTTGWEQVITLPANQQNYTDNIDFSAPGLDYMVEISPADGCMATKAQDFNTSRSNKEKGLFVPGTGTGNSSNGLDEVFGKDIAVKVYPNPVQDQLLISLAGASGMQASFQDIQGKVVLTQKLYEGVTSLDMHALSAGVYFVNLQLNGISEVVKIVKQ
jgi:hypothetical protein